MPERDTLYSVRGPKIWTEMTSAEIADALTRTDAVLIGVSSTEQAGRHLPVGSDSFLCTETLRRTVGKLARDGCLVLAGPIIPFGIIPYFRDYPGSIHLSAGTLKAVIKEVCMSVYGVGFRRLGLVMGHVGNVSLMQVAAQEIVDETDARVLVLNAAAAPREPVLKTKRGDGHAGEGETSCNLALHPGLVRMDLAVRYTPEPAPDSDPIPGDRPFMFGGAVDEPIKSYRPILPQGTRGDPFIAEVETGERIFESSSDWYAAVIKKHWFAG